MALALRDGIWQIDLRSKGGSRFTTGLREQFKKEAQIAHDKALAELVMSRSDNPKAKEMELKDALEKLLNDPTTTYNTQKGFNAARVDLLEFFGPTKKLHTIDEEALDSFVTWARKHKKLSDKTINRKLAVVSKLLKFSHKKWKVIKNVPDIPWLAEPEGRIRWIDHEEEREVVNYFQTTVRVTSPGVHYPLMAKLVPFLIDTGMRLGEALDIDYKDIDLPRGYIRVWVNKADKPRTIPMTSRVKQILTDLQLSSKPFGSINHNQADKAWALMRECLGKSDDPLFVLHACRHTCATRLLEKTGDITLVKEWLGHRDLRSTMVYAHITPKTLLKGVQALQAFGQSNVTL